MASTSILRQQATLLGKLRQKQGIRPLVHGTAPASPRGFWVLTAVTILQLAMSACVVGSPATPPISTEASTIGWYEAYFTQPQLDTGFRGGPDSRLADAIDQAQFNVHLAVYRLDLWSIRDALIRAHRRGVIVQVIVDSDHILEPEIGDLERAGVPVLGDRRESLMHHKFVVLDGFEVWTGSMNFTVSGAYRNNNNLLRLRSKALAQNYLQEFSEMFERDEFGALSSPDTPHPRLELNGAVIESMFSPDDRVVFRILQFIKEAEQRIEIMVFTLTQDAIADALILMAGTGIEVVGVAEASMIDQQGSDVRRLQEAGLDIRLLRHQGLMHHKVIIVDGEAVLLGSYNFSRSAEERNDENVLILYDASAAEEFRHEFQTLYLQASER